MASVVCKIAFFITLQAITNKIATLIIEVDIYYLNKLVYNTVQCSAFVQKFHFFLAFPVCLSPIFFSNLDSNCSNMYVRPEKLPGIS